MDDSTIPVSHFFQSVMGKMILRNCQQRILSQSVQTSMPVLPIILIFWSDDFEPNKSIKSNRQSVWIKTVTLIVKNDTNENVSRFTYPVAVGNKETVHEEVEQHIVSEL
jgi:hypothetical protein